MFGGRAWCVRASINLNAAVPFVVWTGVCAAHLHGFIFFVRVKRGGAGLFGGVVSHFVNYFDVSRLCWFVSACALCTVCTGDRILGKSLWIIKMTRPHFESAYFAYRWCADINHTLVGCVRRCVRVCGCVGV